jgi:anti-sigma B factor antagonist
MPDIQVDVRYNGDSDEIAVIEAKGFIDTTTAPELEKKLEEQLALNKYKIIVNLENIDYVSSAGWGVFVSEIREIRENSGDLVLVNMSPDVYDVYELMEFSSILKSYDSVDEAVSSFTGKEVRREEARPAPEPALPQSPAQGPGPSTASQPQGQSVQAEAQAQPPPQGQTTPQSGSGVFSYAQTDLGKHIIQIIVDNPYFDVKEIARALKLPQYGGMRIGGGAVKKELRSMGLADKQQRFELALKGRG